MIDLGGCSHNVSDLYSNILVDLNIFLHMLHFGCIYSTYAAHN
jgi:hypothetical protein